MTWADTWFGFLAHEYVVWSPQNLKYTIGNGFAWNDLAQQTTHWVCGYVEIRYSQFLVHHKLYLLVLDLECFHTGFWTGIQHNICIGAYIDIQTGAMYRGTSPSSSNLPRQAPINPSGLGNLAWSHGFGGPSVATDIHIQCVCTVVNHTNMLWTSNNIYKNIQIY